MDILSLEKRGQVHLIEIETERLLSVETDAAMQLSFWQVALGALNEADHVLDCPKN